MDFLRRHMFVIICGLVAAGGIAAGVTGHQSMAEVGRKLENVVALDSQLGSLQTRPVNARQIESARTRIDLIVEDYNEVVDRAKKLYDYSQLVADALPYGEPQLLIEFRRVYHDAMNAMLDSLSWGTPASDAEVRNMQDRIDEEVQQRRAEALEQGLAAPPDTGPKRDEAGVVTRTGAEFDARVRADLAAAQRIYTYARGFEVRGGMGAQIAPSLDFNVNMKDLDIADPPYPEDVWQAQLSYWIQKDVIDVITSLNSEAAEQARNEGRTAWVGVMPVKDVISVRVSTDFVPLDEGDEVYGGAPEGYDEALPPSSAQMVFTGSGSGEAYEVVQTTVKLVMDQRHIPRFVERLSNNSFHTVLRISYQAVPPNRTMRGKIYGSGPAVIVVMDFETILLGDVFRRLMPAEIRELFEVVCRGDMDDCAEAPEE